MRIIFGVGTGYDRDGKAISYATASALNRQAIAYLAGLFGGVFFVEGDGAWVDDRGKLIEERGAQFTVETSAENVESVRQAGEHLRELFNQSSVIVSVSQSSVSFITSEELAHA